MESKRAAKKLTKTESRLKPASQVVRAKKVVRGTKDLILRTAIRVASTDGIEGLTIGELAKKVGMSKSGLFAHFQGRDQLQLKVLEAAQERFLEQVFKPAFAEPRGEPRIRAMFDNWMSYLNGDQELPGGSIFISASIELDDRPGPLRDYVQSVVSDLIDNLEKAAKFAVEEGHFRPDLDTRVFAWTLYSFVLGYHHFRKMLEDPNAERYLRQSFQGLLEVARKGAKNQRPIN